VVVMERQAIECYFRQFVIVAIFQMFSVIVTATAILICFKRTKTGEYRIFHFLDRNKTNCNRRRIFTRI